jgi:molybdopterin-guanine dinucleotide biosynthesis protein A
MSRGISGLILAGGAGRRLGGRDKGLVMLGERPLVAHVIARFAPQVDTLAISANRNLADYAAFGHPVVADALDDAGPLAGIAVGLERAAQPLLAIAPCDCPFLPLDLVARLHAALLAEHAEIACAAVGGRLQAVCALLDRGLAPSLRAYLAAGGRKVERWYAQHRLAIDEYPAECTDFANTNTPEELAAAAERAA